MHWSVVGHERQKEYIERLIADGRLGHAYVFAGSDGIGKRMMAEDIAQELVPQGYGLDILRLAPERDQETGKMRDIPIERTRELKSWIALRPTGASKVIIIDDADRLGGEAANNLLKILEEPPAYAHFFLVTGTAGQVMPTIASRCERVDFRPLTESEMTAVLKDEAIGDDDRHILTLVATGTPGLALRLIRDKRLGVVAQSLKDLSATLKGGIAEKLAYAKTLADDEQAPEIISWWLAYTHGRLADKPQLASLAHGLLDLSSLLAQSQYNRRLALEDFLLTHAIQ